MIGDHHGRSTGRATVLARAVDAILGTHTPVAGRQAGGPPVPPQLAAGDKAIRQTGSREYVRHGRFYYP